MISVSLALSQTPVYTARPRIRGYCIARCACLRLSFCWYSLRPHIAWLGTCRDGLFVCRQSPIQVLTGLAVK